MILKLLVILGICFFSELSINLKSLNDLIEVRFIGATVDFMDGSSLVILLKRFGFWKKYFLFEAGSFKMLLVFVDFKLIFLLAVKSAVGLKSKISRLLNYLGLFLIESLETNLL